MPRDINIAEVLVLLNNCKSIICDQSDCLRNNGLLGSALDLTSTKLLNDIDTFIEQSSDDESSNFETQRLGVGEEVLPLNKASDNNEKINIDIHLDSINDNFDNLKTKPYRSRILKSSNFPIFNSQKMNSKDIICFEDFEINSSNAELIDASLQIVLENVVKEVKDVNAKRTVQMFRCKFCPESFHTKCVVEQHIQTHHVGDVSDHGTTSMKTKNVISKLPRKAKRRTIKPPSRMFECKFCTDTFRRKGDVEKHIRSHVGDRPYPCTLCELKFRHRTTLKEHMLIHTGEKPFKCDVCQKSFRQKGTLNVHKRLHTGEKPHKCEHCGAAFRNQSSLIVHVRVHHTFERPFLCELCSSTFITSSCLSEHMRRHNGIKPYKCNQCLLKFVSNDGLKRHKLTHSGEKPYVCDFCSAAFRQHSNMQGHIKRIHLKDISKSVG